jgi:hypothetical protein
MKIIQSYWSKPAKDAAFKKDSNGRFAGGWSSERLHYTSWSFSCLKLRQFYDKVELYTDSEGKKVLIDQLKLPYTKVHICLDHLDHLPSSLWAMPKIYTYSLQDEPFLHVDGDVYIWSKFPTHFNQAALVAQHYEVDYDFYRDALEFVFQSARKIPVAIKSHDYRSNGVQSVNAGVLGGNKIEFFKEFSELAFSFVKWNKALLRNESAAKLNFVLEQYLFYRLALNNNIEITYLLNSTRQDYADLMRFHLVPHKQTYIHLVGSGKQNENACRMIELHLQAEFPEYWSNVNSLFEKKNRDILEPTVKAKRKDIAHFFPNTIDLIVHFTPKCNRSEIITYKILKRQVEKLFIAKRNSRLLQILTDIYQFENIQYLLYRIGKKYNKAIQVKKFNKVKRFLSGTEESIRKRKFMLANNARILLLQYNVPEIVSKSNWLNELQTTIELDILDEYVFVFVKELRGEISFSELKGNAQLLYYLSAGPVSCNELARLISEEGDDISENLQIVLDVIENTLTYEDYLDFAE